jgi:hypothetical protein
MQGVPRGGLPRDDHPPVAHLRDTIVPLAVNSWLKGYTAVDRMRKGLPVIVPGDGLTLWTITHNSDFAKGLVGLLGHTGSIGHAFHITSDEALTWNQIYRQTAEAGGRPRRSSSTSPPTSSRPACPMTWAPSSATSRTPPSSTTRRSGASCPDYVATTRFSEGIARTIAWYDADPARRHRHRASATWDRLIGAYDRGLAAAVAGVPAAQSRRRVSASSRGRRRRCRPGTASAGARRRPRSAAGSPSGRGPSCSWSPVKVIVAVDPHRRRRRLRGLQLGRGRGRGRDRGTATLVVASPSSGRACRSGGRPSCRSCRRRWRRRRRRWRPRRGRCGRRCCCR